ncbi:mCG22132, isoform CRA_a, partial [Mus musculus]
KVWGGGKGQVGTLFTASPYPPSCSLSLSLCLSLCPSLSIFMPLSVCLCVYVFVCLSVSVFVSISMSITISLSLYLHPSSVSLSHFCLFLSSFFSLYHCPSHPLSAVCVSLVPDLHENPSHLEVQQGQSLRLLCTADSQPPATLSWVLEDQVLSWSSPVGSRTLALELPWVKAGDSGHYTCQAENRLGSQQHTLDLSVLYPPQDLRVTVSQANRTVLEILRNAISLPVLEGQSLCLVCVTYSNPPANVSWAWVTQTLIPIQSSEPGVLELPLVQREHEGEFTCAAQNPLGAQRISLSLSVHCE